MKCKSCKNEIPDGSIFCNWCGEKQIKPRKKKNEIKIPKPVQLESGNWFIRLRAEGQSNTLPTEEEAKAWARAIRAGFLEEKKKLTTITLRQAIDAFTAERVNTLSPSTIRGYNVIRDNRFSTAMDKPLSNDVNWQALCDAEAAEISAKTLQNSWMFIATILKHNGYNAPKVKLPQIVQKTHAWLEPDQIIRFVELIRGAPCEIPALLGLHSLRRSEICALTWEDNIDLEHSRIFVSGALVPNKDGKLVRKDTNKNASSQRYVPILIPELKAALEAVPENERTGPVVSCHPNTIFKWVNEICAANGLPMVGTHGLRHSFASLAYHLDLPELEAMRIGGWADRETMHKIYTHLSAADASKHENKMHLFFVNKGKLPEKEGVSVSGQASP